MDGRISGSISRWTGSSSDGLCLSTTSTRPFESRIRDAIYLRSTDIDRALPIVGIKILYFELSETNLTSHLHLQKITVTKDVSFAMRFQQK